MSTTRCRFWFSCPENRVADASLSKQCPAINFSSFWWPTQFLMSSCWSSHASSCLSEAYYTVCNSRWGIAMPYFLKDLWLAKISHNRLDSLKPGNRVQKRYRCLVHDQTACYFFMFLFVYWFVLFIFFMKVCPVMSKISAHPSFKT